MKMHLNLIYMFWHIFSFVKISNAGVIHNPMQLNLLWFTGLVQKEFATNVLINQIVYYNIADSNQEGADLCHRDEWHYFSIAWADVLPTLGSSTANMTSLLVFISEITYNGPRDQKALLSSRMRLPGHGGCMARSWKSPVISHPKPVLNLVQGHSAWSCVVVLIDRWYFGGRSTI